MDFFFCIVVYDKEKVSEKVFLFPKLFFVSFNRAVSFFFMSKSSALWLNTVDHGFKWSAQSLQVSFRPIVEILSISSAKKEQRANSHEIYKLSIMGL